MKRHATLFLPVIVGLAVLALGFAALRAGDGLRSESLERQAAEQAATIARGIQQRLLEEGAALAGLTLPFADVDDSSEEGVTPAGDAVYWHFDGRSLDAMPRKYLDDRTLLLQLRNIAAPAVLAPLTSATGRDLVLVTIPTAGGWAGITIPADTLIPKSEAPALQLDSLELSWEAGSGRGNDSKIFRAGLVSGPQHLTFPVPGGNWRLKYDSVSAHQSASLQWALYAIVFLLSYVVAVVLYRIGKKPQALRSDLDRLNDRFIRLNENLHSTLASSEKVQDRIRQLSVTDAETGLPNRQAFKEQLERALSQLRTTPEGGPLCIVLIGLRDVEKAAHTVGQFMLETVLPEIVTRLRAQLPDGLHIARTNTYQVGVLFTACEPEQCVQLIAKLANSDVSGIYQHRLGRLNVAPRFGIATTSDGYGYADRMLDDAMSALSDAESGESRWSLFTAETRDDRVTMLQLESDFKAAIDSNEFRLFFQPIVHASSGQTKGFESLVRWQHPVEGLLPPDRFIGLSESTGLITELTRWVVGETIRHARAWKQLQASGCYLSINLSTRDLQYAPLAGELLSAVDAAGLDPSMFRLEITETTLIDDLAQSRRMITELRQAGFATMLDDFGTGFSSLSYLQQLPFSAVKIDKSFTRAITSDAKFYGMMQNIVNLVHFLEMETIIEGVETRDQYDLLIPLDPGYCQGYYFARPMAAVDAEEYLLAATIDDTAVATGR